nr:hypothetical protein [Tanacetum cinerariifolium]
MTGKGFSGKETPLFPTMVGPNQIQMGEGWGDSLVRATTTASSLEAEHDSEDVGEEEVVEVVTTAKMIIGAVVDDVQVTTAIVDILVSAAETIVTTAPTITAESTKKNVEQERELKRNKKQMMHLINTRDNIQAKIDVDAQLAQRLHEEEMLQLTDAKKAILFIEFIEKRRKFFATKRYEEKSNKPPTKAQQMSIMSTYLKNIDVRKIRSLKKKSFTEIYELFDKAMKKINTFVDYKTELVVERSKKDEVTEGSLKRAGGELEQENAKKQKMKDGKESVELKQCLEIILDDGDDLTIDATPLSTRSLTIVDYNNYKKRNKNYIQIFRADGNSQMYLTFSKMLKFFDREDLEVL